MRDARCMRFFRSCFFLLSLMFCTQNSSKFQKVHPWASFDRLKTFKSILNVNQRECLTTDKSKESALISCSNKWLLALSSHTSQPSHLNGRYMCDVCTAWETKWCRILMKSHGLCEIIFRIWIDKIWQPKYAYTWKNRFIQRWSDGVTVIYPETKCERNVNQSITREKKIHFVWLFHNFNARYGCRTLIWDDMPDIPTTNYSFLWLLLPTSKWNGMALCCCCCYYWIRLLVYMARWYVNIKHKSLAIHIISVELKC